MVTGLLLLALVAAPQLNVPASKGPTIEPKKVGRLVKRIDQHQRLFRDHNYSDAYEMLGSEWRRGAKDKKEEIRFSQKMGKGIRLLGWEVRRIWIAGDRARVRTVTRGETRATLFRWNEFAEEEDHFWIFENNDWYYIPLKLRDWDDSKAVEVPVPKQPGTVHIEQKE